MDSATAPISLAPAVMRVDVRATAMSLLAGALILAAIALALLGGAHTSLDGKERT